LDAQDSESIELPAQVGAGKSETGIAQYLVGGDARGGREGL
jgi:hypothetical protein